MIKYGLMAYLIVSAGLIEASPMLNRLIHMLKSPTTSTQGASCAAALRSYSTKHLDQHAEMAFKSLVEKEKSISLSLQSVREVKIKMMEYNNNAGGFWNPQRSYEAMVQYELREHQLDGELKLLKHRIKTFELQGE